MAEPYNTPMVGFTPRTGSPQVHHKYPMGSYPPAGSSPGRRLRVLHLGDPISTNLETYELLASKYDIVRLSAPQRERASFAQALRDKTWGDFEAIKRPVWLSGGEIGQWDAELISLLPATVRVFASAATGYDWVDTEALGKQGILYCNGGAAAADAVADFAVAMIISTFRHMPQCIKSALSGSPAQFTECHLEMASRGQNLRHKVLGVIGLSNIGSRVAKRCYSGFGMKIYYYDVKRKKADVEASLKAVFHAFLETLLAVADCVVLCTPAPYDASALINASTLAHFRRGGRLVNIARGSLVNEEDVVDALESGHLSSVALDVFANEPHIHPRLKKLAAEGRALLTCHNAGGTVDTTMGFAELSMRNVLAVLGGEEPLSAVNSHTIN